MKAMISGGRIRIFIPVEPGTGDSPARHAESDALPERSLVTVELETSDVPRAIYARRVLNPCLVSHWTGGPLLVLGRLALGDGEEREAGDDRCALHLWEGDVGVAEVWTGEVEAGALLSAPIYDDHKRGKNWLAVIGLDPQAPGGFSRRFLPTAHGDYYYMVDSLKVNDPLEFAADRVSGSGRITRTRWYGVVVEITEEALLVERFDTGRQAVKAAAERKKTAHDAL